MEAAPALGVAQQSSPWSRDARAAPVSKASLPAVMPYNLRRHTPPTSDGVGDTRNRPHIQGVNEAFRLPRRHTPQGAEGFEGTRQIQGLSQVSQLPEEEGSDRRAPEAVPFVYKNAHIATAEGKRHERRQSLGFRRNRVEETVFGINSQTPSLPHDSSGNKPHIHIRATKRSRDLVEAKIFNIPPRQKDRLDSVNGSEIFATTPRVESYLDLPGAEVNRQPSQELCGTSNEGSEIDRIQTYDASDSLSAEGSQIAGTFGESDDEHSPAPPHRPTLSLLDSTLVVHAPNALVLSLALKIFDEQNFRNFVTLWRRLKYACLEADTHGPNSGPLAAYLEVETQPGLDPRFGCVRAAMIRCQKAESFAPTALWEYDRRLCQHNAYIDYEHMKRTRLPFNEEEQILWKLKEEENRPWKDIAVRIQTDFGKGKSYQVDALRMRLQNLRKRMRTWTETAYEDSCSLSARRFGTGPNGSINFLASDMTGSDPMEFVSKQLHTKRKSMITRGKRVALWTASFGMGVLPLLRNLNWYGAYSMDDLQFLPKALAKLVPEAVQLCHLIQDRYMEDVRTRINEPQDPENDDFLRDLFIRVESKIKGMKALTSVEDLRKVFAGNAKQSQPAVHQGIGAPADAGPRKKRKLILRGPKRSMTLSQPEDSVLRSPAPERRIDREPFPSDYVDGKIRLSKGKTGVVDPKTNNESLKVTPDRRSKRMANKHTWITEFTASIRPLSSTAQMS